MQKAIKTITIPKGLTDGEKDMFVNYAIAELGSEGADTARLHEVAVKVLDEYKRELHYRAHINWKGKKNALTALRDKYSSAETTPAKVVIPSGKTDSSKGSGVSKGN